MTNENTPNGFGGFDPAEYEEEVLERWGDTDAYRESNRRAATYGKEDWQRIGHEADAINAEFIALMEDGVAPDSSAAMAVAERHRAHISKWFYECTAEIHAGLGQMYVADPRFTENIDRAAPGLARYMSEAIAASSVAGHPDA